MNSNSIFSLFSENVNKTPQKIAIKLENESLSYHELYQLVINYHGEIPQNTHVAVVLENSIEFVVLLLLASKNNFVLVPFAPNMAKKQLTELFIKNDIEMLIDNNGITRMTEINKKNNDNYIIVATSGSTSEPKPIVLTQAIKLNRIASAQLTYHLDNNDVMLISTPMYHSLAQRGVLLPLVLGATAVILKKYSPSGYLQAIKENNISFSFSVSNQLEALIELDCTSIRSLKSIVSSSYTLKVATKLKLIEKLQCEIHECYGTSEIGCATNLSPENLISNTSSVGKALPHVEIMIINKKNGVGEIAVKTTTKFKEYYKMPEVTTESFIDSYFKTGDLGYIENGFLHYMGRTKELIKTGAISVFPIDIEKVLLNVNGVKECAVIGVDDNYFGEIIVAIVTGDVKKSDLRKACVEGLAPYQLPMHYDVVDSLPKNNLGKLQKFKLKDNYKHLNIGSRLKGLL